LGPNLRVFPLEQTRDVGVAKSDHDRLTNGEWMDGWLGFNGILSTQVAAISCLRKFKVC